MIFRTQDLRFRIFSPFLRGHVQNSDELHDSESIRKLNEFVFRVMARREAKRNIQIAFIGSDWDCSITDVTSRSHPEWVLCTASRSNWSIDLFLEAFRLVSETEIKERPFAWESSEVCWNRISFASYLDRRGNLAIAVDLSMFYRFPIGLPFMQILFKWISNYKLGFGASCSFTFTVN